jgi:hypothetical protein
MSEAKMVLHPDHYDWTSHHHYFSQNAPEWMAINVISSAIKKKTGDSYSEFINKPIDREKWKPGLFLSENGGVIIDTDVVRNLHPILNANENEYKRKKKSLSRDFVADIVCKNLNVNYDRLLAGSHDRKICCMRTLLVHFWLAYTDMNITDISKHLRRTRGTLQRQLDRVIKQKNNYFFSESIHKIQSELDFFLL